MPYSKNPHLTALWQTDRASDRALASEYVHRAVSDSGGDISEAAKLCGVSRRTMYRWVNEMPELADIRTKERAK